MHLRMKPFSVLATLLLVVAAPAVEISEEGNSISIDNESVRLSYDLKSGTYSGTDLRSGLPAFSNARFSVDESGWKQPEGATRVWKVADLDDAFGKGNRLSVTETPNAGYRPIKTLHISLYDEIPFAVLGFSVTNHTRFPARIAQVGILEKAAFLPKLDLTDPQVLRGGAGAEPNRVENQLGIEAHNNILATGKVDGKRLSFVVGIFQEAYFFQEARLFIISLAICLINEANARNSRGRTAPVGTSATTTAARSQQEPKNSPTETLRLAYNSSIDMTR